MNVLLDTHVLIWWLGNVAKLGKKAKAIIEMERSGFRSLAVTFDHAFAVRKPPLLHRDPFDRMLIAQAQSDGLTLVTADPAIMAYEVRTIDATV